MRLPCRRFGRTELNMPLLSLGGMRFQKSWSQLNESEITKKDQIKVDSILGLANKYGFDHIETARHYGTSELQLGKAFKNVGKLARIVQTKIPPNQNVKIFEQELVNSFEQLGINKIDLVAIHGINNHKHLIQAIKPDGCIDVLKKWQRKNLIGNIGFSTHGDSELIEETIRSNKFDYVNLHWYFINQQNANVIKLAKKYDLGVFLISPTDKGGHLHTPSEKLLQICNPLHPIIFNDLFCLMNRDVHTISVGIAKETDFDYHLEAVSLLPKADLMVPNIINRFRKEEIDCLGLDWYSNCYANLPHWRETPRNINLPVLIWLSNLFEAWDMHSFVKSRYQLLGNGGHWFPGCNANDLDLHVSEGDLINVLQDHINPNKVIEKLRILKSKFGDESSKRLSSN